MADRADMATATRENRIASLLRRLEDQTRLAKDVSALARTIKDQLIGQPDPSPDKPKTLLEPEVHLGFLAYVEVTLASNTDTIRLAMTTLSSLREEIGPQDTWSDRKEAR